jgi:hypothetical protein
MSVVRWLIALLFLEIFFFKGEQTKNIRHHALVPTPRSY